MNLKQEIDITASAGAMVGHANREQWGELLEKHGGFAVRAAIANVKRKRSSRQATIEDVAKELGHKLKATAHGKVIVVEAEGDGATVAAALDTVLAAVDGDDQVDEDDAGDEEPAEHEPSPAAPPQPATEMQPKASPLGVRKNVDYATVARQIVEFSVSELARAAGVAGPCAAKAIKKLLASGEVKILDSSTRNKRYLFLTDDVQASPALAQKATPTVVDGVQTTTPIAVPVLVNLPASHAIITSIETAGMKVEQQLRDQLKDRAPDPLLTAADIPAITVTLAELAGPLRPLMERLLDGYGCKRGYLHTLRELATCQDLVRTN